MKVAVVFILFIILFGSCVVSDSNSCYIPHDNTSTPVVKEECVQDFFGRKCGKVEKIYDKFRSVEYFRGDSVYLSYCVENSDTFNVFSYGNYYGKWLYLNKGTKTLVHNYYNNFEITESFIVYYGESVTIKSPVITINTGDTINYWKASSSQFLNFKRFKKVFFNKNGFIESIEYTPQIPVDIFSTRILLWKNLKIAARLDVFNNSYENDSVFDRKGKLLFVAKANLKKVMISDTTEDGRVVKDSVSYPVHIIGKHRLSKRHPYSKLRMGGDLFYIPTIRTKMKRRF